MLQMNFVSDTRKTAHTNLAKNYTTKNKNKNNTMKNNTDFLNTNVLK